MEFYDPYDHEPPCDIEFMEDDTELVEADGYIPLNVEIANLMTAGISLNEYRKALYNNGDFVDELTDDDVNPDIDPTAQKSFDEFTAYDLAVATTERLRQQAIAAAEATKAAQAEAKAQDAQLASLVAKNGGQPLTVSNDAQATPTSASAPGS